MLEELVEEIEDFRDFIWFSCCYIRSKSVHRADLGLYFEAGQISNSEDALCDAVQSIWGQKSTVALASTIGRMIGDATKGGKMMQHQLLIK